MSFLNVACSQNIREKIFTDVLKVPVTVLQVTVEVMTAKTLFYIYNFIICFSHKSLTAYL